MAAPRIPSTLIDLTPERPQVLQGPGIVEMTEGSLPLDPREIIQENKNCTYTESTEAKPRKEYEAPLTPELIDEKYLSIVSAETHSGFFTEVPGTPAHETVRQRAKTEITQEFLWRMGLPSEYIGYLDIDEIKTRELLSNEYFSIPAGTDRDNHVNNFDRRSKLIRDHIIEMSEDPDIEERLATTTEIWRQDLLLRAKIIKVEETKQNQSADKEFGQNRLAERQHYLDQLMDPATPDTKIPYIIQCIGSTMLGFKPAEVKQFSSRLAELSAQDAERAARVKRAQTFIQANFLEKIAS